MTNKKVLIIGGNGFIGRNLCRTLLQKGMEVYSFDIAAPELQIAEVHYIAGDFFDDTCLLEHVKGKDIVVHAISTINPGNSNERYMQGYSGDFVQSVKLCTDIIEEKAKLIFLSSGGTVYGNQEKQPITEQALPSPINHYGTVKLCIENVIRTFNTQLHTKNVIARISNPYGPGQDYHKGVGFVDAVLKKTLHHEPIEIWGDGENIRDYIFIDDVCEMLYALMEYTGPQEVFNLSSNEGISQNDVVRTLEELQIPMTVNYQESRSVDVRKVVLDNSSIKSVYPKKLMKFKEGIRLYYEYLQKEQTK